MRPRRHTRYGNKRTLMAILACGIAASTATQACEFEIRGAESVGFGGTRQYDVFETGSVTERASLEIRRTDAGVSTITETPGAQNGDTERPVDGSGSNALADTSNCQALLRVSPQFDATLSRGGQRLVYQLLPDSVRAVREGDRVLVRTGNMSPGDSYRLDYVLRVPAEQFVPQGLYRGELLATVHADNSSMSNHTQVSAFGEPDDRQVIPVSVEVGTAARLGLAGTQGRKQRVDFGQLRRGGKPTFPVELIVQASSGYVLRISSDNNGRLRQEASGRNWFVPYEVRVGEQRVLLEQGTSQVIRNRGTAANGQRIPLNFRIIDVTNKRAGVYTDRLIIEITPAAGGF